MTFSLSLLRYVIVGFASVGIAINLGSLIMLMRKRSCTMFHNLLKVSHSANSDQNQMKSWHRGFKWASFIPDNLQL